MIGHRHDNTIFWGEDLLGRSYRDYAGEVPEPILAWPCVGSFPILRLRYFCRSLTILPTLKVEGIPAGFAYEIISLLQHEKKRKTKQKLRSND